MKTPDGKPCKQFAIRVARSENNPEIATIYDHSAGVQFGNDDGSFEIANLPFETPIRLIFSSHGWADKEVVARPVDKERFVKSDRLDVNLAWPSILEFAVVDEADNPIPNARIRVTRARSIETPLFNVGECGA